MYVFDVSSKCSIHVDSSNLEDALSHVSSVFGDRFVHQNIGVRCSEGILYPVFMQDVNPGDIIDDLPF